VGASLLLCLTLIAAGGSPPPRLSETGLHDEGVLSYTPQYPLWSDGATKRRWIRLPEGGRIDGRDPEAWVLPVGTRLWKEFSLNGRPVETRYLERREDGSWLFAAYRWTPDGEDALLVGDAGARAVAESAPGVPYDIPGRWDCRACHDDTGVLGFTALQLSPDRDPLAPHAEPPGPDDVDLTDLLDRGLVTGMAPPPAAWPPRIGASTARERAALGYLAANCAVCHRPGGAPDARDLDLRAHWIGRPPAVLPTAVDRPGRDGNILLAPGHAAASRLWRRMDSRQPLLQMPPLGTHRVDAEALALLAAWIDTDLADSVEDSPFPKEAR
jgi:hypothetical protein